MCILLQNKVTFNNQQDLEVNRYLQLLRDDRNNSLDHLLMHITALLFLHAGALWLLD